MSPGRCGTTNWDTTCNYFEPTYFVRRPTISRSGHSSVKFNVQRRILDGVTSISHSAQQHTYRVSKLHWKTRMLHVKRRNLKAKYGCWLGIQKTRMLDCFASISHFTPCKPIEHWIRMSHVLITLHLTYAHWIVNGLCWIVEVGYWNVKTSNNSKEQCCKLEFEFWRGYNAIIKQVNDYRHHMQRLVIVKPTHHTSKNDLK